MEAINVFQAIQPYPTVAYMLAVVILTWITLYYFVGYTTNRQRIGITGLIGVVLGVVWLVWVKTVTIDLLILGFLASTGFYTYIIKQVMTLFGVDYNDYCGIFKSKPCDDPPPG